MTTTIPTPQPVINLSESPDLMYHGENYAFFDYSEHQADLPTMYGNLLASAESKICIWDPYFNAGKGDSEFLVFSRIKKSLKIELLSHGSAQNSRVADSIQHIKNNLDSTIVRSTEIKFFWISTDKYHTTYSVHDRFLIIDDQRYFLVGSSWGYHSNVDGDRGSTGIFEIENDKDKNIIKNRYDKYKRIAEIDSTVDRG